MLSENIKKELYRLLVSEFETAVPLHMAAVSKFLSDRGVRKEDYGFVKMKVFLSELGFLSLAEETINFRSMNAVRRRSSAVFLTVKRDFPTPTERNCMISSSLGFRPKRL